MKTRRVGGRTASYSGSTVAGVLVALAVLLIGDRGWGQTDEPPPQAPSADSPPTATQTPPEDGEFLAPDEAPDEAAAGQPRLVLQLAHLSPVLTSAVSANGQFVATGDVNGDIYLWHADSGRELRDLRKSKPKKGQVPSERRTAEKHVRKIGFSPDSTLVAAVTGEQLNVWQVRSGRHLLKAEASSWYFSGDSQRLYAGNRMWKRTPSGQAFIEPQELFLSLRGQLIALGEQWLAHVDQQRVLIYGLKTEKLGHAWSLTPRGLVGGNVDVSKGELNAMPDLPADAETVRAVAWTQDEKLLLGGATGSISLSKADSGSALWWINLRERIEEVTVSPDNQYVLARADRAFYVLELATGKVVRRLGRSRPAFCGAFSSDGSQVLTGHGDATARLWDAESGQLVRRLDGPLAAINAVTFGPANDWVAAYDDHGVLTVWQRADGAVKRQTDVHRIQHQALEAAPEPAGPAPNAIAIVKVDGASSPLPGEPVQIAATAEGLLPAINLQEQPSVYAPLGMNDSNLLNLTREVGAHFVRQGQILVSSKHSHGEAGAFSVPSGKPLTYPPRETTRMKILAVSADTRMFIEDPVKKGQEGWFPPREVWVSALANGQRLRKVADAVFLAAPERASLATDGSWVAIDDASGNVNLITTRDGRKEAACRTGFSQIVSLACSPTGRQVAIGSMEGVVECWDRMGKRQWSTKGHPLIFPQVTYSADGSRLLVASSDGSTTLWDSKTGARLRTFNDPEPALSAAMFLKDGRLVIVGWDGALQLCDTPVAAPRKLRQVCRTGECVASATLAPDEDRIVVCAQSPMGLELASNAPLLTLEPLAAETPTVVMLDSAKSRDTESQIATFTDRGALVSVAASGWQSTWNEHGLAKRRKLDGSGYFNGAVDLDFDSAGKLVMAFKGLVEDSMDLRGWNLTTGAPVAISEDSLDDRFYLENEAQGRAVLLKDRATRRLVHRFPAAKNLDMSADRRRALSTYADGTVIVWDAVTWKETCRCKVPWEPPAAVPDFFGTKTEKPKPTDVTAVTARFAPSGATLLVGRPETFIDAPVFRLYDAKNGKLRCRLQAAHDSRFKEALPRDVINVAIRDVSFSPDEKWLAGSAIEPHGIWVFSAESGQIVNFVETSQSIEVAPSFSPDSRLIMQAAGDNTIYLWERETGKLACRLAMLDNVNWAVIDPEGRFDAPNGGAVAGLHWVIDNEPIDLEQLKERYYEPDLLGKKLGIVKEPVREVTNLGKPALPPLVKVVADADQTLARLVISNRGGGIGRVVIKLNGKELSSDARAPKHDPQAAELPLTIDLGDDQRFVKPGRNVIQVEAYNSEGYLRSRGLDIAFTAPEVPDAKKPQLWLVACGVTDYREPRLRCPYAAKDAQDIAAALTLGAQRLFGAERVHATVLHSGSDDPRRQPTRANLVQALQATHEAESQDILVVYLAGHGVTAAAAGGDFYYLCSDAISDDLRDEAVRQQVALSSAALTELIKEIPALKQVMILDTCAAGRLIDDLVKKRDVPSDQTRALDRLKDRTGMYVLAGCAADAVSYEASRYAQGVLTYSLLMGLRGAALRDEQFIDVERLLNYSVEEVPRLAADIGGIQRPRISAPNSRSFDIGELDQQERAKVPLKTVRPLVMRCSLQEETSFDDALNLSKALDDELRATTSAADAPYVFVDGRGLPDSYRVVGRYKLSGDKVTVTVNVFHDKQQVHRFTAAGKASLIAPLAKLLAAEFAKTPFSKTAGTK